MDVSLFDFDLPERLIALRPVSPRDSARLLHIPVQGEFTNHSVSDLPSLLRAGDVLVFNETKVFRAALTASRPARPHGGGSDVNVTVNLHKAKDRGVWDAFCRPAKRLKVDDVLYFDVDLSAKVIEKRDGGDLSLEFNTQGDALLAAFERCGAPPLPPYIARKRAPDERDIADYQTVYAKESGSVAAPTAGLHFTPEVLAACEDAGAVVASVALQVGIGTFRPIVAEDVTDHHMHAERYIVPPETWETVQSADRVIAVGTTSVRALESAAATGALEGDTELFIHPGYDWQVVDALLTNFHLPRSSLLVMLSAFCGPRWRDLYELARHDGYRFLSFGDAMFVERAETTEPGEA